MLGKFSRLLRDITMKRTIEESTDEPLSKRTRRSRFHFFPPEGKKEEKAKKKEQIINSCEYLFQSCDDLKSNSIEMGLENVCDVIFNIINEGLNLLKLLHTIDQDTSHLSHLGPRYLHALHWLKEKHPRKNGVAAVEKLLLQIKQLALAAQIPLSKTIIRIPEVCKKHGHQDDKEWESSARITYIQKAVASLPVSVIISESKFSDKSVKDCFIPTHGQEHWDRIQSFRKLKKTTPVKEDGEPIDKKHHDDYANAATPDAIIEYAKHLFDALTETSTNTLVAGRPPGHHFGGKIKGFCFVNYIIILTYFIFINNPDSRVVIFDWDAHHGDGTAEMFDMLIKVIAEKIGKTPVIILCDNYTPSEIAPVAEATKKNKNIILVEHTASSSDEKYFPLFFAGLDKVRQKDIKPTHVLVSAGFDGVAEDNPIGNLMLSSSIYGKITNVVAEYARESHAKLILSLEGGYHEQIAESVTHTVIALQRAALINDFGSELNVSDFSDFVKNFFIPIKDKFAPSTVSCGI